MIVNKETKEKIFSKNMKFTKENLKDVPIDITEDISKILNNELVDINEELSNYKYKINYSKEEFEDYVDNYLQDKEDPLSYLLLNSLRRQYTHPIINVFDIDFCIPDEFVETIMEKYFPNENCPETIYKMIKYYYFDYGIIKNYFMTGRYNVSLVDCLKILPLDKLEINSK